MQSLRLRFYGTWFRWSLMFTGRWHLAQDTCLWKSWCSAFRGTADLARHRSWSRGEISQSSQLGPWRISLPGEDCGLHMAPSSAVRLLLHKHRTPSWVFGLRKEKGEAQARLTGQTPFISTAINPLVSRRWGRVCGTVLISALTADVRCQALFRSNRIWSAYFQNSSAVFGLMLKIF